jgi:hypothetical protein
MTPPMSETAPDIEYALTLMGCWERDKTPCGPGGACALAKQAILWLQGENARLNMEMVAYRQNLTPKDVKAMTAVIEALQAAKDVQK